MLTGIAPDQVTRMITGVPWYSSRLKPAISSALSKDVDYINVYQYYKTYFIIHAVLIRSIYCSGKI
ncbi:BAQ_1a_G0022870.mRNA.1.CDS.1 [Saccharomyces cerevisiae]|nr:BAQ_1a_G0022870.mRNA.1.CDS.1 [Saccharomyces cerevisiae]CAI7141291.1 BAQ_1a_G0022870.mRNA.1.CDS.1 [Saccharomyces cerevisiae]